ncbi:universal stress protein [Marinobacterium jannaschii]|uniref:universal stress protein n=1 Tax=Marinobacterium jannaschii TaxID=64970 RepID=UPI00047F51ED|nr:universal stress protein [Marinobacterium jannaschii]
MFNNILIPLDLEHEEMFASAVEVATQLFGSDGGKIHALYVDQTKIHNSSFTLLSTEVVKQIRREVKKRVSEVFEQNVSEAYRGSCHTRDGVIYDEILEEAAVLKPDVILVAAGKPGLSSYLLGSNAEKVLRHAECSVFVIRDKKIW